MRAMLASASLTWKYSANTPSLVFENFQPPNGCCDCDECPSCEATSPQSGVMAYHHPIAGFERLDLGADRVHHADGLVTEGEVLARTNRSVNGVRIRCADQCSGRLDDGVIRARLRNRLDQESYVVDRLHDERAHCGGVRPATVVGCSV